jgi:hypothetical protein
MPALTIGFRASGELAREDYRDVVEPTLREAVAAGGVRLMLVAGPEFEGMSIGAPDRRRESESPPRARAHLRLEARRNRLGRRVDPQGVHAARMAGTG